MLVNCEWTEWRLGECVCNRYNKTSASGTRFKTREIKVKASNGGKECIGSTKITVPCINKKCKGKRKTYLVRD